MKEGRRPSILRFPRRSSNRSEKEPMADVVANERKIWNWLNQHVPLLIYVAFAILILGAISFIFRWLNEQESRKCLQEYRTKTSLSERVAWAENTSLPSSLKNIQGFVFLEQANKSMKNGAYAKAMLYYQKAKKSLLVFPLREQANIGYAYAALNAHQLEVAEKELQAFYQELQIFYKCPTHYLRAQALYALCEIAAQRKDLQQFHHYKTQLQACEQGDLFLPQIEARFSD